MDATNDKRRAWLRVLLEEGLNLNVISPEDVLRHADPAVLATDLPPQLVASLLQAGLERQTFDPALLVEHLGATQLAAHLPLSVLWSCVAEAAQTIIREHPRARQVEEGLVPQATEDADIEVIAE